MKKIKVIDISYAQQNVDFEKIKEAGVKAVIIRTGYLNKTDTMFHKHIEGAISAGLDIGVYTYLISENTSQAVLEAQQTVSRLEKYKGKINYPVFCDMEHSKYYDTVLFTKKSRTDMIRAFCNTITSHGYYPAVYINPSWLEEWTEKECILGEYDIWLAAWTENPDINTRYDYGQTMWQWGTEKIEGIVGRVDGNLCYVDYPERIKAAGKNFLSDKCFITAEGEFDYSESSRIISRLETMGLSVSSECR